MDIGDKIEEVIEGLQKQYGLWEELVHADEELNNWFNSSITDLNASASSLDDSSGLKEKIEEVHQEIERLIICFFYICCRNTESILLLAMT